MTQHTIFQAASSLHYNFVICWRLLGCLPPSVQYLELINSGSLDLKDSYVLHTLRWAPRLAHKAFNGWTKVRRELEIKYCSGLRTLASSFTISSFPLELFCVRGPHFWM